ncbi:unnamed protein product [Ambrosiozyma monospora]|uniref:Unnamed protein product n=1 Tax=Ambrosiozyma monospora TaxID=43982 RepID=A0A9W6T1B0_AMBMO|nr:unnamed protein product [Ambrosiozyma monospora]
MDSFEKWLIKLWEGKDKQMDNYYKLGKFSPGQTEFKVNLGLRSNFELLNVYIIPVLALSLSWLLFKFVKYASGL